MPPVALVSTVLRPADVAEWSDDSVPILVSGADPMGDRDSVDRHVPRRPGPEGSRKGGGGEWACACPEDHTYCGD